MLHHETLRWFAARGLTGSCRLGRDQMQPLQGFFLIKETPALADLRMPRTHHHDERPCRTAARTQFVGALPQSELISLARECLKEHGFDKKNTLLATSCCPDEINRDLDEQTLVIGRAFSMGGLAGFPFVGKTGFGAYMHHVPADGCMLIICASHVGIDATGKVGKVLRHGMKDESTACGAAVGAYSFCNSHKQEVAKIAQGDASVYPAFNDPLDMQQNYIQKVFQNYIFVFC